MKAVKYKTHNLEKCYSIAPLYYQEKQHILVAAEKQDRCMLFDEDGVYEETIWDGPGGTMSMVQIPGSDGVFLATHKFYSPNDGKEAKIVIVTPDGKGQWTSRVLVELPFVHRFDILSADGKQYIIACTIKSAHEYKDDWRTPGKIWVAELPKDLAAYDEQHQLEMRCLKGDLLKNHGYCKVKCDGEECAVIATESGVFRVDPPNRDADWQVKQLTKDPASDVAFGDFDRDGEMEMLVITPFHGDTIKIYKKSVDSYCCIFTYDFPMEFSHAIWGAHLQDRDVVFLGHRKGKRDLLVMYYDETEKTYAATVLDQDVGPANAFFYQKDGEDRLVATNRETNEIAFYRMV